MLSNKKYSFTELLDFTLSWFTQEPEDFSLDDLTPRQNVTNYKIGESMIKKFPDLNSHHFLYYCDFVLDRLYSDGYVDREPNYHSNKVDSSKYIYSVKLDAFIFQKKGGYKKKAEKEKWDKFWKRVEDAPKRYWFVALFLTSIGFNVNNAVQYFSKHKIEKPKIDTLTKFPQQDTSQNH